jgi:hypothetical protein
MASTSLVQEMLHAEIDLARELGGLHVECLGQLSFGLCSGTAARDQLPETRRRRAEQQMRFVSR